MKDMFGINNELPRLFNNRASFYAELLRPFRALVYDIDFIIHRASLCVKLPSPFRAHRDGTDLLFLCIVNNSGSESVRYPSTRRPHCAYFVSYLKTPTSGWRK